ncbi:class I SAM-dependent methyltransferase [Devosia nitrariae]|uniref:SAM-dependent methyltransferase n=1 Tax=Devosia nitrariae TaxID=2071872 RepID=A0ABQ5W2P9_9HYPH|nr:50S ribosomal protein L11 methyltransferase [Devosia nitrariae]GLQ54126.1 SAM-dependent methyltransferase [Devosia nitrariae]
MTIPAPLDPAAFIEKNLKLQPAPALPEIRLYAAHSGSRLRRLVEAGPAGAAEHPPYWAYHWAGGTVLARHFLDRPQTVAGRRVLDLGAGSGVVGIAAIKAGAASALAAEIDGNGCVAIGLNAAANGVCLAVTGKDLTANEPPDVDLVAVGDLFYARDLALAVTAFLDRCLTAGIEVLIGDPGRAHLPHARLRRIAEYAVPDFGDAVRGPAGASAVYAFEPETAGRAA